MTLTDPAGEVVFDGSFRSSQLARAVRICPIIVLLLVAFNRHALAFRRRGLELAPEPRFGAPGSIRDRLPGRYSTEVGRKM